MATISPTASSPSSARSTERPISPVGPVTATRSRVPGAPRGRAPGPASASATPSQLALGRLPVAPGSTHERPHETDAGLRYLEAGNQLSRDERPGPVDRYEIAPN